MAWQLFHLTEPGGSHQLSGLPCQDCAVSEEYDGARIIIVADGHGSRRHFRSERGSRFACEVALREITGMLDGLSGPPGDEDLALLKERIVSQWRQMAEEDARLEPWTPDELAEASGRMTPEELERLEAGGMDCVPYGSTLVAAFAREDFWAGIQLGDGFLVTMNADGEYLWPMPESHINQGNRTASLCMGDPMPEFRHCVGTEPLTGIAVCTDGIEKAFPPMGEKVSSFLHWLWLAARQEPDRARELLGSYARRIATRSAVKDDVGLAIMADPEAEDVPPRATRQQKERELQQAAAQLEELRSVMDYTAGQLRESSSEEESQQLQQILDRRRLELAALEERLSGEARQ